MPTVRAARERGTTGAGSGRLGDGLVMGAASTGGAGPILAMRQPRERGRRAISLTSWVFSLWTGSDLCCATLNSNMSPVTGLSSRPRHRHRARQVIQHGALLTFTNNTFLAPRSQAGSLGLEWFVGLHLTVDRFEGSRHDHRRSEHAPGPSADRRLGMSACQSAWLPSLLSRLADRKNPRRPLCAGQRLKASTEGIPNWMARRVSEESHQPWDG
jgi:hypothetical protein